jgi:hypothetical protein
VDREAVVSAPTLDEARELLADAAEKARSSGDAYAELAAAAIGVVLAELARLQRPTDRCGAHACARHPGCRLAADLCACEECRAATRGADGPVAMPVPGDGMPRGAAMTRDIDAETQASIDMAVQVTAERCMLAPDPYRALAGAIGKLAQLQLALRRGKGRPSAGQEAAPAGPHRSRMVAAEATE